MDLLTKFKQCIAHQNMSPLEIAWSLHTDLAGLEEIMAGTKPADEFQTMEIEKFIWKATRLTRELERAEYYWAIKVK